MRKVLAVFWGGERSAAIEDALVPRLKPRTGARWRVGLVVNSLARRAGSKLAGASGW